MSKIYNENPRYIPIQDGKERGLGKGMPRYNPSSDQRPKPSPPPPPPPSKEK